MGSAWAEHNLDAQRREGRSPLLQTSQPQLRAGPPQTEAVLLLGPGLPLPGLHMGDAGPVPMLSVGPPWLVSPPSTASLTVATSHRGLHPRVLHLDCSTHVKATGPPPESTAPALPCQACRPRGPALLPGRPSRSRTAACSPDH